MIVIGTLRERFATWKFVDSLNWACRDLEKHNIPWVQAAVRSVNIFKGREQIVDWFLSPKLSSATHLLFIDSDECFDPKTIRHLYELDLPVVTGIVYKKKMPHEPCIYRRIENDKTCSMSLAAELKDWFDNHQLDIPEGPTIFDLPDDEALWNIDECGTGCMMIRRDVLEAIDPPRFKGMGVVGTDLAFCRRVKQAGFDIQADLRVQLGHLAEYPVTTKDFLIMDQWLPVDKMNPDDVYRAYQDDE